MPRQTKAIAQGFIMAEMTEVSESVQEKIHFDTLWSTVSDALRLYSGEVWTARGEHDPGVILLQAICYGISDLAYRHTLPLKDLLTPASEHVPKATKTSLAHEGGIGIFAHEFGPETALTCGPVTLDDMRRALLDTPLLTGSQTATPARMFSNVEISPIDSAQQYQYRYLKDKYAFGFVDNNKTSRGDAETYNVAGDYSIWVSPIASSEDKNAIQALLEANAIQASLEANAIQASLEAVERNVGNHSLHDAHVPHNELVFKNGGSLTVELRDDVPIGQAPELIARVMWMAEDWLTPRPVYETAQERMARGESADSVYEGPRLRRGWITRLPPARVGEQGKFIKRNLDDLSASLMSIPGIRRITWTTEVSDVFRNPHDANQRLQFWLGSDWKLLSVYGLDVPHLSKTLLVLKRGKTVEVDWRKIYGELQLLQDQWMTRERELANAPLRTVPYGRFRDPGWYRSVGELLPPVFDLQLDGQKLSSSPAANLLRFLRPFERLLADVADQLARLPQSLAFDGRGKKVNDQDPTNEPVWGASDWPTDPEDPVVAEQSSAVLGSTVNSNLTKHAHHVSSDSEKELSILDYLLGYFGESRALRTLIDANNANFDEASFRAVQQGFLRQITRLGYDRAEISISQVSALQRRIAARLGVAPKLFDELPGAESDWEEVPFFVIEHQELLPIAPPPEQLDGAWKELAAEKVTLIRDHDDKELLLLDLTPAQVQIGQLIEMRRSGVEVEITPIVIHDVKDGRAWIILPEHIRLKGQYDAGAGKADWQWRFCATWLSRVVYRLKYAPDTQLGSPSPQDVTLDVTGTFPVDLHKGDYIACRPTERWSGLATTTELTKSQGLPDIVMQVQSLDPVNNRITVRWVRQVGNFKVPGDGGQAEPVNLRDTNSDQTRAWPSQAAASKYGWAVPNKDEDNPFAFTVSVVFDQKWLAESPNPIELDQWIRQTVREETPSHLFVNVQWLSNVDDFRNFRDIYKQWQGGGRPVGDLSYKLLSLLGLGTKPLDARTGIGFLNVASPEQAKATVGTDYPVGYLAAQVIYVAP